MHESRCRHAERAWSCATSPQPVPKPNEVLVQVKACGPQSRRSLGGRARLIGHGAMGAPSGSNGPARWSRPAPRRKGFKPGDRVMCSGSGGYAEYAVADYGRTAPLPDGASASSRRAALPIALITLHNALVTARPAQGRRERADPGRQLRRRADGPADRQAEGRQARDRLLHQRRAPRAAEGIRRRSRDRHARRRRGPIRCWRRPAARASNLIVDMVSGPTVEPDHAGDRGARPHRQCRAARRREGRVRFRPARA